MQGSRLGVRNEESCSEQLPSSRAHISAKHVEQIISAINHSVASGWFSSLRIYSSELRLFIAYYTTRRCQSELTVSNNVSGSVNIEL